MASFAWFASRNLRRVPKYTVSWQPAANVAGSLAGSVKVQPKTAGTSILAITIQSTNAQMAADIVNNLMIEYDSMTVEQNNHSNDQIIGFIRNRLNQMDQELDSLKLRFLKYKQDHKLYDVEKISGKAFANLTETLNARPANSNSGWMSPRRLTNTCDQKNKYNWDKTPSALVLEDPTLNQLTTAYNKAILDRKALVDGNVPPSNPWFAKPRDRLKPCMISWWKT